MERIAEVLELAEFGVVLLWKPSEGVFRSQAMYGPDFPNLEALRPLKLQENESVTGRVYAQGEAVILNNAAAISTVMDKFGVLILDTLYRRQAFSAKDVPFVQILADHCDDLDSLQAYIHYLCHKLEVDPANPELLMTSPGI